MATAKDAAAITPEQPEPATGPVVPEPEPQEPAQGPPLVWDMPGQPAALGPAVDASVPHPSPPADPPAPGNIVLAAVEPLGSVTLPPLNEGGKTIVITRYGTEVDEATAARAWAATGGHGLREIKPG